MVNLLYRLCTSIVFLGGTAFILFRAEPGWFALEVGIVITIALFEFFTLIKKAGIHVYRFSGVFLGMIIPLLVYMELGQTRSGEVLFLVISCLFLFVLQFLEGESPRQLIAISLTLFGLLYVSWFLSFLIKIRFLNNGEIWIVYLVAVTKIGDIGAYAIGTLFGKHALIPHISPKKSIEGTLSGFAASTLVSALFKDYLPLDFTYPHLLLMGFLIGVVAQIGDLSESLMKRFCKVKDSGQIMPGMGGMLDAVDSVLFTAPLFYFHLLTYPGSHLF